MPVCPCTGLSSRKGGATSCSPGSGLVLVTNNRIQLSCLLKEQDLLEARDSGLGGGRGDADGLREGGNQKGSPSTPPSSLTPLLSPLSAGFYNVSFCCAPTMTGTPLSEGATHRALRPAVKYVVKRGCESLGVREEEGEEEEDGVADAMLHVLSISHEKC